MTKYEPPQTSLELFKKFEDIMQEASNTIADELTKELIEVFEQRAQFFTLCGRLDYAQGVQDCIDHLKAFLET